MCKYRNIEDKRILRECKYSTNKQKYVYKKYTHVYQREIFWNM